MKTMNPLSNMQSIQQAPIGLPPAIAQYYQQQQQQQQAPQSFDQSQLAQYIQQLQNNGASPEQIQGVVQQIQQNGGNAPQTEDTMQGGAGQDTISGGGASQSPLSQALNQMASGQGNINYDQVNQAYPSMRPPVQNTEGELYQQELGKLATAPGGGIATMLQAQSAAKADQTAQSNALAALQNQRDVNAFGATTGIAEKAGAFKHQADELARQKAEDAALNTYRKGELGIKQQNADADKMKPLGMDAQGNAVLYDMKTGETKTIPNVNIRKPTASDIPLLSSAQQDQITKASHQALGLDKTGKPISSDTLPIAGEDLDKMESAAGILMATGKAKTAKQAFTDILSRVKLVGDKRGFFGGDKGRIVADTTPLDNIITGGAAQLSTPNVMPNVIAKTAPGVDNSDVSPEAATPIKNGMAAPRSKSEYDALPRGTKFIDPEGRTRTKP